MNTILMLAALAEAGTGVILLADPPLVVHLLFEAEITGAAIVMSRLAGICLIALGTSCWPGNMAHRALYGMLTFGTLAMLYLAYVGVTGLAGILLWPAVAVHAGLSILLVRAWLKQRKSPAT